MFPAKWKIVECGSSITGDQCRDVGRLETSWYSSHGCWWLAVESSADVRAIDGDGNTVLHHAVDKGFGSVRAFLASHGVDLNAMNNQGHTVLAIVERGRTGNIEAAPVTVELLRTLVAQEGDTVKSVAR